VSRFAYDLDADDADDAGELPEARGDGSLPGYDAWKLATPPEYAELRQARETVPLGTPYRCWCGAELRFTNGVGTHLGPCGGRTR
jgi:hypothetical protein